MARLGAQMHSVPPEARVVIVTAPGAEAQVDYGARADGARPRERQVQARAALRADARVQSKVGASAGLEVVVARLGRAARARRLPPARRCPARRRARQSARGRHHARHLRLGAQSSVPRRARPLRRRRAALPRARPRSQGQGRVRRGPRAAHAASCRECASKAPRRRKPISIAGRRTGPICGSTARRRGRSP